ncbi:MAG: carbamoyl transferase, partial [Chitinophagaceae bacterium]
STTGHDPAFAVANENGEIVFAESTERFVQQKRAWGIDADHPEHIRSVIPNIIPERSNLGFSRSWLRSKMNLAIDFSGAGMFASNDLTWMASLQDKAFSNAGVNLKHYLKQSVVEPDSFDHHLCHAVNACASFEQNDGLCLVIDGEGEVGSVSVYRFKDRELIRLTRSWGPGSLGSYYGYLTELCGFDWRKGEEWKVMGLAAYGKIKKELLEEFKSLLTIKNGKVFLSDNNLNGFSALTTWIKTNYLDSADIAATGQQAYAYFVNEILDYCKQFNEENLIISGGCALNSSFNGSIMDHNFFKHIHVPYAPGDDGNAIGAALLAYMKYKKTTKVPFIGASPYLGTDIQWDDNAIKSLQKLSSLKITNLNGKSARVLAQKLYDGNVVGVLRGRAEFGPRALGNRSILANPTGEHMKDHINDVVKGRESYRPFAPIVHEDLVSKFFAKEQLSPYMSFTLPWKSEVLSLVPAVVHKDGTGRLQTVNDKSNKWLCELLSCFGDLSGIPILLNTSFNVMGKPIVHSLNDAIVVLMTTGLDAVLYDDFLIEKNKDL